MKFTYLALIILIPLYKCITCTCKISDIDAELKKNRINILDAYIFVIIGPILLLFSTYLLFSFFIFRELRKPPGDILFILIITEFSLISLFISIGYERIFNEINQTKDNFCFTIGYLMKFFFNLFILYNCNFIMFLILKLRSILKKKNISNLFLHLAAFILSIIHTAYYMFYNKFGRNYYGLCGEYLCDFVNPILNLVKFSLYLIISIYGLIFFKKTIPNEDIYIENKKNFINYYSKCIFAFSFFFLIEFSLDVYLMLNIFGVIEIRFNK